jgi:ankyrin repeat protein
MSLQAASCRGPKAKILKLLIEKGADINYLNQYFVAHNPEMSLNVEIKVQILLNFGAQIVAFHLNVEKSNVLAVWSATNGEMMAKVPGGNYRYALHTAAYYGYVPIVSLLWTQSSEELDIANHHGETPFLLAAKGCHVPVLDILYKPGTINVNFRSRKGCTAIW